MTFELLNRQIRLFFNENPFLLCVNDASWDIWNQNLKLTLQKDKQMLNCNQQKDYVHGSPNFSVLVT